MERKTIRFILQTVGSLVKPKMAFIRANEFEENPNFQLISIDNINQCLKTNVPFLNEKFIDLDSNFCKNYMELHQIIFQKLNDFNDSPVNNRSKSVIIFYLGEWESFLFLAIIKDKDCLQKLENYFITNDIHFDIPYVCGPIINASENYLSKIISVNIGIKRVSVNLFIDYSSIISPNGEDEYYLIKRKIIEPLSQLKVLQEVYVFNIYTRALSEFEILKAMANGQYLLGKSYPHFIPKRYTQVEIDFLNRPLTDELYNKLGLK